MRRSTEKQVKFENEARAQEPSAQKNRSDNRITNILALDNGTMVQVFKYLKYSGLAKTSLVSKRFCDLIRTHRHTLALLDVKSIGMHKYTDVNHNPTGIEIFDKVLSAGEYNEWVVCNHYSKQISQETQSDDMQSTEYERKVYRLSAHADYKDSTPAFEKKSLQNFFATIELSHENWPVFQHFFRLLTDPFVHIRSIRLPHQNDALNLLAGAINTDCVRLQCHLLTVILEDNDQYRIDWIKGHVRCYEIYIADPYRSNNHRELLDLFMTGANCTSKIDLEFYDPCKVIDDFVQKFMDLKSGDEDKVVGFIECHPNRKANMDAFNRNYADFVVEGNINQTRGSSDLVFEFVNNDIGKKMRLEISFGYHTTEFTLKVANL